MTERFGDSFNWSGVIFESPKKRVSTKERVKNRFMEFITTIIHQKDIIGDLFLLAATGHCGEYQTPHRLQLLRKAGNRPAQSLKTPI